MTKLRSLKALISLCCMVAGVLCPAYACYSPTVTGPEEMYLEDVLADLAEGRGCFGLGYPAGEPKNVACRETPNEGLPPSAVFVDKVTGCTVTESDVPTWNFGYDFRFERLGKTKLGMWIYEGYGDFTYIVKERKLVDFCKGRVQPTEAFPPCSCADSDVAPAAANMPVQSGGFGKEIGVSQSMGVHSRPEVAAVPTPTAKPR